MATVLEAYLRGGNTQTTILVNKVYFSGSAPIQTVSPADLFSQIIPGPTGKNCHFPLLSWKLILVSAVGRAGALDEGMDVHVMVLLSVQESAGLDAQMPLSVTLEVTVAYV